MFEENQDITNQAEYVTPPDTGIYHTADQQTGYQEPLVQNLPKTKKKSAAGRIVAKACKLVVSAAIFGLVAGTVFYGVNYYADKQLGTNVVIPAKNTFEITTAAPSGTTGRNEMTASTGLGSMDVSDVVKVSMPAMVSVTGTITQSYGFSPFFGGGTTETPTAGSGVIIGQNDKELLIVTNAHVVENVNNLQVMFVDGNKASATVKGMKTNKDIAVIAVALSDLKEETREQIVIIEIGDSSNLEVGQPVIAIGNALGEGQSVTVGWVSALNNTITIDGTNYEDLIRISAAINRGNSGGALLNTDGQLVGINSAKYIDEEVEGIGYAIPISSVADIINDLVNRVPRDKVDEKEKGYLGVSGIDITSDISKYYGWPIGFALSVVEEGSAADKAGLVKNDVLVSFDGVDIATMADLQEALQYYGAGETVVIEYYRLIDGEHVLRSTEVTLGSRQ